MDNARSLSPAELPGHPQTVAIFEHLAEGFELRDSPSFTWRAFAKLGLTPTADLFTRIKQDDIIEIHSVEGVFVAYLSQQFG